MCGSHRNASLPLHQWPFKGLEREGHQVADLLHKNGVSQSYLNLAA